MTRFATATGLALAAVALGTAHRADAQTRGIETVYPAPSAAESKSMVSAYSAPPRAGSKGIETVYPANYAPRETKFPAVVIGPPLPAGGIRSGPAATSLGVPSAPLIAPTAPTAPVGGAATTPVQPGTTPPTQVQPGTAPPTQPGVTPPAAVPPGTTPPPADTGIPPEDVGTLPPDATTADVLPGVPSTVVYPTVVGPQVGVAPSTLGAQLITDPYGGGGPAYYLPPTSQPVTLAQPSNNTTVPSTNVWRNSATPSSATATVVNPALYSNGVIVRQARSANPYSGPRYVVSPARR